MKRQTIKTLSFCLLIGGISTSSWSMNRVDLNNDNNQETGSLGSLRSSYNISTVGNVSTATQTDAYTIENIIFKLIREKTDVFMEAINEGLQLQQERESSNLENNAVAAETSSQFSIEGIAKF